MADLEKLISIKGCGPLMLRLSFNDSCVFNGWALVQHPACADLRCGWLPQRGHATGRPRGQTA